jgi:uncharacterized protein (DUF305 family)
MRRISFGPDIQLSSLLVASALVLACAFAASAQEPVVVQPGAPGQPTKTLPSSTRAQLPPTGQKDIEFMQGMIMHHQQAVEMTALIPTHSTNKELRVLGDRISHSQADEIRFMKRWLITRGQSTEMKMDMSGMDMGSMNMGGMNMSQPMLMPGMLTATQMAMLRNANGKEFDRLFLEGMIQHHGGALTMVKDLYASAGAGQDAELFTFTTDVDSGQRAEIRIMQSMLDKLK